MMEEPKRLVSTSVELETTVEISVDEDISLR